MDEEFVLPFFHDLGPRSVPVRRIFMLQLAADALKLKISQSVSYEEDKAGYLSILQIHAPSEVSIPQLLITAFSGEYCSTKEAAMESASHRALVYMQTINAVIIDDLNYTNLVKCQKELVQARSWSDIFQHAITKQQSKVADLEKALVECREKLVQSNSSSAIFQHETLRQKEELAALKKEVLCLKEESVLHQIVDCSSGINHHAHVTNEGAEDLIGTDSHLINSTPCFDGKHVTHARRALFR